MRVKRFLFILVALVMTLAATLSFSSAFAGVDRYEIVNLNAGTNWKIAASDNIYFSNRMVFNSASTASNATAVITSNFTKTPDEGVPYFVKIVSSVSVSSFANSSSYFAFNFGLKANSTKIGGDGRNNVAPLEVYLAPASESGKVKVGIRYVGGEELASIDNAAILQAVVDFNVAITAVSSGQNPVVEVDYGNNPTLSYTLDGGYPYGYIGVGQYCSTGSNQVSIEQMSLYNYSYTRASNYNFTEDFEYSKGTVNDRLQYDSRLIYSKSDVGFRTPSALTVQEDPVTTNRFLKFNNTGFSFFATKEYYSNFEMTFDYFDVPQMTLTKNIDEGGTDLDGDGIPDIIANGMIQIGLGIINSLSGIQSYSTGAKLSMYIGWSRVTGNRETMIRDGDYHFFGYDSNGNPRSSYFVGDAPLALDGETHCNPYTLGNMKVKISVIDGIFSVWFVPKAEYDAIGDAIWDGNAENQEIDPLLSYDMGYTPNGCVAFFVHGSSSAPTSGDFTGVTLSNGSVDNIKVVNKDSNPQTIDYNRSDFVTNLLPERPDTYYRYEDFYNDNDLLGARIEAGVIDNSFLAALFDFSNLTTLELIILIVSAVLIVATIATVVIVIVKKGKKPTAPVADAEASGSENAEETAGNDAEGGNE